MARGWVGFEQVKMEVLSIPSDRHRSVMTESGKIVPVGCPGFPKVGSG